MNTNEFALFDEAEKKLPDCTGLPIGFLLKSVYLKARRHLWGKVADRRARLVWTTSAVSDADGPTANVRNYLDQQTIRTVLGQLTQGKKLGRACEVGSGYGRVILVLKEFADKVVGYEREQDLVDIAARLNPEIEFRRTENLAAISDSGYDLAMTCTVLQHLTDEMASRVCEVLRSLAAGGHVLIIEKTAAFRITENTTAGDGFISRNRSVEQYSEFMKPFRLVRTWERKLEPTYGNPQPGTCLLFAAPSVP